MDESPGNRDPMTWFMRVKLDDGSWPSQGPMFKRQSARIVGETDDFAKDWIDTPIGNVAESLTGRVIIA